MTRHVIIFLIVDVLQNTTIKSGINYDNGYHNRTFDCNILNENRRCYSENPTNLFIRQIMCQSVYLSRKGKNKSKLIL